MAFGPISSLCWGDVKLVLFTCLLLCLTTYYIKCSTYIQVLNSDCPLESLEELKKKCLSLSHALGNLILFVWGGGGGVPASGFFF